MADAKNPPNRTVDLANYNQTEGNCACGCGFEPTTACLIAHQAFHDSLERRFGRRVRHLITGGVRCRKHEVELVKQGIKAVKNSRHVTGEALDGIWKLENPRGTWVQIPNAEIARLAVKSGLFGGVGHKSYVAEGKNLVHLDVRPGSDIDVW